MPTYEAAEEFMRQVCENLDCLMDIANGPKQSLSVLDKETAKQEERLEQLWQLLDRQNPTQSNPNLTNQNHPFNGWFRFA